MKLSWLVTLSSVMALTLVGPGQERRSAPAQVVPREAAPPPNGRYQLIAAEVENQDQSGNFTSHEVFLLDTQTGSLWRFQARFVSQQGVKSVLTPDEMLRFQFEDDGGH